MKTASVITYPSIVSALGGAEFVTSTARTVRVKLPGRDDPVKLRRSECPPADKWTAFNLADLATAKLA